MKDAKPTYLPIDSIFVPDQQIRKQLDPDRVKIFENLLLENRELTPVVVFPYRENPAEEKYYLIDGFHRLKGHQRAGRKEIKAEIDASKTISPEFLSTGEGKNYIALHMAKHNCGESLPPTRQELKELVRSIIRRTDKRNIVDSIMEATKLPRTTVYEFAGDLLRKQKRAVHKKILELRKEGKKIPAIATELGLHENTVSRHIHRTKTSQEENEAKKTGECKAESETSDEDRAAQENSPNCDKDSQSKGRFYEFNKYKDGTQNFTVRLPKQIAEIDQEEAQMIMQILRGMLEVFQTGISMDYANEITDEPKNEGGDEDKITRAPNVNTRESLSQSIIAVTSVGEEVNLKEIRSRLINAGLTNVPKEFTNGLRVTLDRMIGKRIMSKRKDGHENLYRRKNDAAHGKDIRESTEVKGGS